VVVIPEHGGVLLVRVVIGGRLPRFIPVFGITVAGGASLGSVKVDNSTNRRLVRFGPVKVVVDGQKVLTRQIIDPFHE
jgi:hypothetical protein